MDTMKWRSVFAIMLILLMAGNASAFEINSVTFNPVRNANGWFDAQQTSVQVNVELDEGPANVTIVLLAPGGAQEASVDATAQSNTTYSATLDFTNKEGINYTVEAQAVWDDNGTLQQDALTKKRNIDTVRPTITDQSTNQTTIDLNSELTITASVTEQFVQIILVGEKSQSPLPLNMTLSGGSWELIATPADLGCSLGECILGIRARDRAGNTDYIDDIQSLTLNVTNGTQSAQTTTTPGLSIEILSPAEGVEFDDSKFNLSIKVNTSDAPSSGLFCRYTLRDAGLLADGVEGAYDELQLNEFSNQGNNYYFSRLLEGVGNSNSYEISVECYDDQNNLYQTSNQFGVDDVMPPPIDIHLIEVTNESLNLTVNSTEEFKLEIFEYKILSDDNRTVEDFDTSWGYEFNYYIEGLEPGREYVFWATGVDRADNDFDETEVFETLGGEENESEDQSVYDVIGRRSNRTAYETNDYPGENYSHGISRLMAGEDTSLMVTNFDMNLREFIINTRENMINVKLDVVESENPPPWIQNTIPSDGKVFQYYLVDSTNAPDQNIRYVKIRFEVNEIWLQDNGYGVNQITLFRLDEANDKWNQLPTTLIKEGALLHTYEALSPGFSLFAVSTKRNFTPGSGPEDTEQQIMAINGEEEQGQQQVETTQGDDQDTQESDVEGMAWYWWVILVLGGLIGVLMIYYVAVTKRPAGSDELEDHKVVKAHMKRLEKFVDNAMAQGYTKEQLRGKLIENGWEAKLVDFVLRRK